MRAYLGLLSPSEVSSGVDVGVLLGWADFESRAGGLDGEHFAL
jgi:hypothetical protein